MVNQLVKIPLASSPTLGDKAKVFRDRKWTFSEAAKPKAPTQPTLDAGHKKLRQSAAPSVTAKQVIELGPKTSQWWDQETGGITLARPTKLVIREDRNTFRAYRRETTRQQRSSAGANEVKEKLLKEKLLQSLSSTTKKNDHLDNDLAHGLLASSTQVLISWNFYKIFIYIIVLIPWNFDKIFILIIVYMITSSLRLE